MQLPVRKLTVEVLVPNSTSFQHAFSWSDNICCLIFGFCNASNRCSVQKHDIIQQLQLCNWRYWQYQIIVVMTGSVASGTSGGVWGTRCLDSSAVWQSGSGRASDAWHTPASRGCGMGHLQFADSIGTCSLWIRSMSCGTRIDCTSFSIALSRRLHMFLRACISAIARGCLQ